MTTEKYQQMMGTGGHRNLEDEGDASSTCIHKSSSLAGQVTFQNIQNVTFMCKTASKIACQVCKYLGFGKLCFPNPTTSSPYTLQELQSQNPIMAKSPTNTFWIHSCAGQSSAHYHELDLPQRALRGLEIAVVL